MVVKEKDGFYYYYIFSESHHLELEEYRKEVLKAQDTVNRKYHEELMNLYDEDIIQYEVLYDQATEELNGILKDLYKKYEHLNDVKPEQKILFANIYEAEGIH